MKEEKVRKTFSISFKKEQVRLIEKGKFSISQVSKLYDISYQSVYKWKLKYGIELPPERMVIETESDYVKVVQLSKKMVHMEQIIGKQQILIDYYMSLLQHAKEHYNEDFEKKFGKR